MEFVRTSLNDAYVVRAVAHEDERGSFARIRCNREFESQGLPGDFVQANLSYNKKAGTFRGLHYQAPPSKEGKLVRCIAGAIADVIVDIRPNSRTYLQHEWFALSADEPTGLFIPSGFAHGFLTMADETTVMYDMSDTYAPDMARGIRWSDPLMKLELPTEIKIISQRDAEYTDVISTDFSCFA
jgi:dTDP-4-dehydrorhamnose 3,5-epimerase